MALRANGWISLRKEGLSSCRSVPKRSVWLQISSRQGFNGDHPLLGDSRVARSPADRGGPSLGTRQIRAEGPGTAGQIPNCPSPLGGPESGITPSRRPHPTRRTLTERHFPGYPWREDAGRRQTHRVSERVPPRIRISRAAAVAATSVGKASGHWLWLQKVWPIAEAVVRRPSPAPRAQAPLSLPVAACTTGARDFFSFVF